MLASPSVSSTHTHTHGSAHKRALKGQVGTAHFNRVNKQQEGDSLAFCLNIRFENKTEVGKYYQGICLAHLLV